MYLLHLLAFAQLLNLIFLYEPLSLEQFVHSLLPFSCCCFFCEFGARFALAAVLFASLLALATSFFAALSEASELISVIFDVLILTAVFIIVCFATSSTLVLIFIPSLVLTFTAAFVASTISI